MTSLWQRARKALAPGPRALAVMAVMLATGLFTASLAYIAQLQNNRDDAATRFEALANRVTFEVGERLRRYEYGLRGARGVVLAGNGTTTREAFKRYADSRQIELEFPGARGFGVIWRVAEADQPGFVHRMQAGGLENFSVHQFEPQGGERYVITLVEPLARNREAIGLDIASELRRRDAADLAAVSGKATLSAPVTLVQASGSTSRGLLLLLPIYQPGAPTGTPRERENALIGWSYAPLLVDDVMQGLDVDEDQFSLDLYDREADATTAFHSARPDSVMADDALEVRLPMTLYGRTWDVRLRPSPAFLAALKQPSPATEALEALVLGLACSGLIAALLQLMDRTRGQRLEQARRAAIVEGSSDAVIVQNLDGVITDWNGGAARLFGYPIEQAKGRTATELLLPQGLEREDEDIRRTVAGGDRVQVFETLRRASDGTLIPVSITASPIHDANGVVVGAAKILRDVREARAAEQRMRELNASLEDQVRERTAMLEAAMQQAREANEAKSRFLANMSHEIRTPMNAVMGLSHVLGKTVLNDDQAGLLTRIQVASKGLLSIINDVLDLSKIEAGEMRLEAAPFDIDAVVRDVASLISVAAEDKGIGFEVMVLGDAPRTLVGDSTRLRQVLLNLLSNAVKFTSTGGVRLQVQLTAVAATTGPAADVSLRVTDTGIGIPAEVQGQLFQPFVQADTSTTRRFGGTGLGLSIVRQLVALMSGQINLQSAPGKGSEFRVDLQLPVSQEALTADVTAAPVPRGQGLTGLRLLVVDDIDMNREVASRLLRSEGADVVLSVNGQEALATLATGATFDAVLMDVQMPVLDGLSATRRIRATPGLQALPIIGLTAGVGADEQQLGLSAGMNAIVGKPFDPEHLVATIRRLRAGQPAASGPQDATAAASRCPPEWPRLAGIDAERAYRQLKGDTQLLRRLLDHVLATLRELPPEALSVTPQATLTARLHDLKGTAGTLAATTLQTLAAQAERLLRAGDTTQARPVLAKMAALRPGFEAERARLPAAPAADADNGTSAPLSAQALQAWQRQLKANDLQALDSFQPLRPALRRQLGDLAFARLVQHVESLAFDAAVQVLEDAGLVTSSEPQQSAEVHGA